MRILRSAADKSIPKKKLPTKIFSPWWDKELDTLRGIMRRANKEIKPMTTGTDWRRRDYNKIRNDYVSLLRKNKIKSWRNFAGDWETNPWGRCFRWLKKGSSSHEAPSKLKKENGEYTKSLRETLRYLLDTFIPSNQYLGQEIETQKKEED